MTGLLLQRVVVAALLAVTFLLASPFDFHQWPIANAATTEDTEVGGDKQETGSKQDSEKESSGVEEKVQAGADKADGTSSEPSELPPLDLGTGTTAKETPTTEDVLAEGVTATASPKGDATTANPTTPAPTASSDALDPRKLWTPNSGRFLLKDRQAGLALASSAETEDKGDGKQAKPVKPKSSQPRATKPPSVPDVQPKPDDKPATAATKLSLPSETATPENESDGGTLDLPDFLADVSGPPAPTEGEAGQPVGGAVDSQVDAAEPEEVPEGSPLVFSLNDSGIGAAGQPEDTGVVGIIRKQPRAENAVNPTPDNNGVFNSTNELGENVVGVSPWRGLSVFLLCLGLMFAAYWASQKFKGKVAGLSGKTLAVIETIGIGAGRQIIIIEMNDDALILGVTPNSINLLDKVPLATLDSGYSATVDGIISREGSALPGQWESRPSFDTTIGATTLAPPIQSGTYGPSGQAKTSVAELRRTRQAPIGTASLAQVAQPPTPKNPKDELIGRFRSQLNRFED